MKTTIIATIALSAEVEAILSTMDVAGIIATPIAQDIACTLTERSPYHAYGIADCSIENDGETMVFTIDTDYFNNYRHFSREDDFEIFFNAANRQYTTNWADLVVETSAAYDIGEEIHNALYQRHLLNKHTGDFETEWFIEGGNPEVKDRSEWGGKNDGLIYRYTITIE